MKHSLAVARQVEAAEAQARLAEENNRLLLLICAKLGIDPDAVETEAGPEVETEAGPEEPQPATAESPSGKKK